MCHPSFKKGNIPSVLIATSGCIEGKQLLQDQIAGLRQFGPSASPAIFRFSALLAGLTTLFII
jgi:hypothetical protein